ncbi:MAG: LysR family transcriptional regulator [Candidatus Thiodiazotropha sp. L084R]
MLKQRQQQFLDNRLFKAFMAAAETENFTSAAKRTFMTQSGISQHIARLEKQVGLPLFKRVAKHVTLTDTGKRLKKYIENHCSQTEAFLGELREAYNGVAGTVSYAMPPSCLLLPHFLLLLEKRKQYPLIRLDVSLALDPDVVGMVLEDQIDFGLVTGIIKHPNLVYSHFCQEEYVLAAASPQMISGVSDKSIYELPSIAYPGVDIYFNSWLRHYFPRCRDLGFLSLPISGKVNSIEGAIKMVQGGLGVSVLPRHCIEKQLDNRELFEFKSEQKSPLFNDIYVVSLKDYAYPQVVRLVMACFNITTS